MKFIELQQKLSSYQEWQSFTKDHSFIFSDNYINEAIAAIKRNGILDINSQAAISADNLIINGSNYRETIKCRSLNSRNRALVYVLKSLAKKGFPRLLSRDCKIYAPEALTDFALYMRGKYPRFIGSEYACDDQQREDIYPIVSEDLLALSFGDGIFDLVITNDVLEHVPSIDKALEEMSRVLKSRGVLLTNVPFAFDKEAGLVRAIIENDEIIHLLQAKYHGNPLDPSGGSLVFEIPGWDLVSRAKSAGFSDAYFMFISSLKYGILGQGVGGVFVFVAHS